MPQEIRTPRLPWPRRAAIAWKLFLNFAYDFRRFRSASSLEGSRNRENRRAHVHLLAHALEYGMALSDPRKGFGVEKIRSLCAELRAYIALYGTDETVEAAVGVLRAHLEFNAGKGADTQETERLLGEILTLASGSLAAAPGGTEFVRAEDITSKARIDFEAFMGARNSVRQYASDRPVDRAVIDRVVRAAQQTPSSCNRQTCKVYAFTDPTSVARVLAHHDGNRGFGDQLGGVFVVTVDLANWNAIGERNQGWVDGGMFAMTLALALHAEGLGACMLNWSAERERDRALRRLISIPDNEVVITLIGFGHMRDEFRVPVSRRKPLDRVLQHEPKLIQL
jgi:nitroreductase